MRKKAAKGDIVIRAGHQDSDAFLWFYRTPEGRCYEGSLDATLLPKKRLRDSRVTFLMPTSRLFFYDITLGEQVKNPSLASLLWQIEDELLCEAETLHGVVLESDSHRHRVAVVDKKLFAEWLERLRQQGITPDAVYPDILALPCNTAVKLGEDWLIRYGPTKGLCASESQLAPLWERVEEGTSIRCYSTPPSVREGWEKAPDQTFSMLFTSDIPTRYSFLTRAFQPRIAFTQLASFRTLIGVSVCCGLLLAALPFLSVWSIERQARELESEARQLVKSYFPQLPDSTPWRPWLEQKLDRLSAPQATRGPGAMLKESYALLAQIEHGRTEKMAWDGERQILELTLVEAPQNLATLAEAFSTGPIQAQVVPQRRDRVQLIISRKSDERR
ncbi:type II secretion system protein GspL [Kalamiella sp. sgz302252]|uniref:type II secretion system protein GspL n=1 Tax=Pantoea sp. sgz302252 TaxID=3341827 RepID=UPI0036D34ABB